MCSSRTLPVDGQLIDIFCNSVYSVFIFPFVRDAHALQGYVICESEKRFLMLFTFLRRNRKKKVMVFFSSCLAVKFFHELLNYIDLPVMSLHVSLSMLPRFLYQLNVVTDFVTLSMK